MINTSAICSRGCGNQEIETLTHEGDVHEGDASTRVIAYEMKVWLRCGHQKSVIMSQSNIDAVRENRAKAPV